MTETLMKVLLTAALTAFLGAAQATAGAEDEGACKALGKWDFSEGEGLIVHDKSGNGNDGRIEAPEWLNIDGLHLMRFRQRSGTAVSMPYSKSLAVQGSFSLVAWLSLPPATAGGWRPILFKKDDLAMRELDGEMTFANWNGSDGKYNYLHFQHGGISGDGRLHQFVVSYDKDASCVKMYMDGILKRKYANLKIDFKNNNSPMEIGRGDGVSADIVVSSLALYGTALKDEAVAHDYKARQGECARFADTMKIETRTDIHNFAEGLKSQLWEFSQKCAVTNAKDEAIDGKASLKCESAGGNAVILRSKEFTGKRLYRIDFDYRLLSDDADAAFLARFEITPPYPDASKYYKMIPPDVAGAGNMDLARQFKMLGGQFAEASFGRARLMHKSFNFEPDQASRRRLVLALRGKGTAIIGNLSIVEILPQAVPPNAPELKLPVDGEELSDFALDYVWSNSGDATRYELEVSRNTDFSNAQRHALDDNGIGESYFRPQEFPSEGLWHWRVRGFNEYGQTGAWSAPKSYSICARGEPAAPSRQISEREPLFVINWSLQHPLENLKRIWDGIPQEVRPFCAVYAMFHQNYSEYLAFAKYADENKIPYLTMDRLMFKYGYRQSLALMPLSLKEELYRRSGMSLGGVTVEQSVCDPEVIDYNVRLIKLAAKYGKRALHIDFGPHVALRLDDEWAKAQADYAKYAIPILKCVFYSCDGHSSAFGWWLTHKDSVWGIQPEAWYFHQSGYEKLNQPPLRHVDNGLWNRRINARVYDVVRSHPANLWGIFMTTGLISGGTVYPFELFDSPEKQGGETTGFWHSDGTPTKTWTNVVKPLMEDIVAYGLIPSRAEVERKVRCAYVIDKNYIPMMDKTIGSITTESGPLQAFMDVTYGKHYWCDIIPKTSRYYYVPIVFSRDAANLPKGVVMASAKSLGGGETIKSFLDNYYPPAGTGTAFVAQAGNVTAVMNSNENSDIYEDYNFGVDAVGGVKVEGIVGVHQYLIAKTLEDKSLFVHVNNRVERNSTIKFTASSPIKLKAVPEQALIESKWDDAKRQLTVTVNHQDGAVRLFLNPQ